MILVLAATAFGLAYLHMVRQGERQYRETVARRLDAVCR
jgi:hypothetical protein